MITNSVQMSEVAHAGERPLTCWNGKCGKTIQLFERYFLDTLWDRVYCHQCGLCLRYARKKAIGRGDPVESAEIES